MNDETLNGFNRFFSEYADRYILNSSDPEPLILKKDHTLRVCREIVSLGNSLSLPPRDLLLAETMALFHDLGRFRQYETYKTFVDQQSENHARLSLQELRTHDILGDLSHDTRRLIEKAVGLHNVADLPQLKNKSVLFFTRLLRDADKLDIWRVVIDNYTTSRPGSRRAVNLGLDDDKAYTAEAVQAVLSGTFVRSRHIKRLNDLKLMQISWIFDVNFAQTLSRVKARRYIDKIAAVLPPDPRVSRAVDKIKQYMNRPFSPGPIHGIKKNDAAPGCLVSGGADR